MMVASYKGGDPQLSLCWDQSLSEATDSLDTKHRFDQAVSTPSSRCGRRRDASGASRSLLAGLVRKHNQKRRGSSRKELRQPPSGGSS